MAKEYLEQRGVKVQEIDVSASHKKAEEMIKKSGQMKVPVIEIGSDIIIGFDVPELEKALKKKTKGK
jgi:glutaredoxin